MLLKVDKTPNDLLSWGVNEQTDDQGSDPMPMLVTTKRKALIQVEVPEEFMAMQVPPGYTLKQWLAAEQERLTRQYPDIKHAEKEVNPDLEDMLDTADHFTKWFLIKSKLTRLRIREEMEYARRAVNADGMAFAERRMFPVKEHNVRQYDVDAVYAVRS